MQLVKQICFRTTVWVIGLALLSPSVPPVLAYMCICRYSILTEKSKTHLLNMFMLLSDLSHLRLFNSINYL